MRIEQSQRLRHRDTLSDLKGFAADVHRFRLLLRCW